MCGSVGGGLTPNDSLTVEELRSRAHDILYHNHDRDYKSLICYPIKAIGNANIMIIRVSPPCNFSAHVIGSVRGADHWLYLASYQEHIRMIIPMWEGMANYMRAHPSTTVYPRGWQQIFQLSPPFDRHRTKDPE